MNSTVLTLNRWAGPALALAWPMLWQSSLLIAFLFALDFAFRRKLRASVRYALWLVVLVKLALPPSLALPTGLGWWLRPAAAEPATPRLVSMVVTYGPAQAVQPPAPISLARSARPPARLSAGAWGLAAWGAVGLGLLAWMLVRWRQVAREARRAVPAPDWLEELFVQARRMSGLRRPARLRLIGRPMSPAVCGLFRPVILAPRALAEQLPPDQLRAVLLHELVHLRRGDLWLNLVQALLQIAYWWHPLLWLANARIRRAREEAVDDAVMLALKDDAEAYAPTLLRVARLALSRPPVSLGLVGILESRTFLRQRIERLLDFRPPRKAGLTLASLLSVGTFAALALPMGQAPVPAPKPEPPAAAEPASAPPVTLSGPTTVSEEDRFKSRMLVQDGKLLYEMGKLDEADAKLKEASRLDPRNKAVDYYLDLIREARSNEAATPSEEQRSSKSNAARLVQDGKLLYEMGKLDEAEAKLKLARKEDPENDGANYYLNLVSEARYHTALNERDSLPKSNPWARTNLIFAGRGRKIIVSKLEGIRLAEVKLMENLPLSEVVKYIDEQSRKSDPEGHGINFIIATNADTVATGPTGPTGTDPATGLPTAAESAEPVDMNAIRIRIPPALHDIRLADFLEIIVKGADKPIKCSIEDYAVVFYPKGRETTPLYFRTIKLDPNAFEKGMRHFLGLPESGNGPEKLGTIIRKFFAEIGVDISPPKSMFYGDRQGTLLVYATLADLDIIERAVQVLNMNTAPTELNIKAVFIELPKADVEAFWEKFGNTNQPARGGSAKTATLTHSQAAAQLDRWKSSGGTNILGIIQVTTLDGRQAQVSMGDWETIMARYAKGQAKPEKVPFGPTLDIIPHLTPDRIGVQMDLEAKVVEFIGYDDPGPVVARLIMGTNAAPIVDYLPFDWSIGKSLMGNGTDALPVVADLPLPHFRIRQVTTGAEPATVTLPLPHFRIRQAAATVEVQDGQTVVLGCLTMEDAGKVKDQVPGEAVEELMKRMAGVARLFRAGISRTNDTDVLIFVTPTVLDPAGNRIHPQKSR